MIKKRSFSILFFENFPVKQMVLLKNGSCPCNRCHPPRFLHLWEAHCVCVQGVVREAVELLEQVQRHLSMTFVNDCVACRE